MKGIRWGHGWREMEIRPWWQAAPVQSSVWVAQNSDYEWKPVVISDIDHARSVLGFGQEQARQLRQILVNDDYCSNVWRLTDHEVIDRVGYSLIHHRLVLYEKVLTDEARSKHAVQRTGTVLAPLLTSAITPSGRRLRQEASTDHYIELRYLHSNGSPVKKAQYHIRASGFSADGMLDDAGFVHVAGVPPIGGFTYWFDKDPEPYLPAGPKLVSASAPVKAGATSAIDDVLDWLWGSAQGDFNKDASLGQIAVNTVLGLVPLVDQALDVRDLISGLKDIVGFYMEAPAEQKAHEDVLGLSYEAWLWLALFLIALGCIPEVGSAVKGVAKGLIKLLQDAAKKAGDLSPAQLRRIWEELLKILNHFGIKPGNAHEWLKKIPAQLGGWMDHAAVKIKGAMDALGAMMSRAERLAGVFGSEKAAQAVERLRRARAALSHAYGRLEAMKRRINDWLKEQFERVLGGKHHVESSGGIDTKVGHEGANVRTQEKAAPPEPTIPPKVTRTTPSGKPGGKPSGTRSDAGNKSLPKEKQRAYARENESADALANKGYQVEQNPATTPNGKNPDLNVEGKTFDVLSPTSSNVEQVRKGISKKVGEEQTSRIVLNLDNTSVDVADVKGILDRKPIEGLQEVIAIKGGVVTPLLP